MNLICLAAQLFTAGNPPILPSVAFAVVCGIATPSPPSRGICEIGTGIHCRAQPGDWQTVPEGNSERTTPRAEHKEAPSGMPLQVAGPGFQTRDHRVMSTTHSATLPAAQHVTAAPRTSSAGEPEAAQQPRVDGKVWWTTIGALLLRSRPCVPLQAPSGASPRGDSGPLLACSPAPFSCPSSPSVVSCSWQLDHQRPRHLTSPLASFSDGS
jgi:hypothetical protein